MERTRTLLESCFKELLNKVTINRVKTINFPTEDTLIMPGAPSSITKTPQPRYISGIYLNDQGEILVSCITQAPNKRFKARISEYNLDQFDEYTIMRILHLGIKYLNAY